MNTKILISFAVLFLINALQSSSFAYEVDNFTLRYTKLEPADKILDQQVNDAFAKVVEKANKDKIGCSQSEPNDKSTKDGHRQFRAYLKEAVAPGRVIGVFEETAEIGNCRWLSLAACEQVPKHKVALDVSVYGGTAKNKFILAGAGINSSINLGNTYIGTDKLGHFFDQGFEYYKRWTLNGSETDAANIGRSAENGMFGKMTTGIKSNADLAANFSGFQFWRKATEGSSPYFQCSNGQWTQAKAFQWKDFVNPAWDEAINCSEYATPELEKSVEENLKTLEQKAQKHGLNRNFQCPVDLEACANLGKLYKARHYVNSKCLKKNLSKANGTGSSSSANGGTK